MIFASLRHQRASRTRPARYLLWLTIVTLLTVATVLALAAGWSFDMTWSYANANVVHDQVAQDYYPHAIALLQADSAYRNGSPPLPILQRLQKLPGVKSVLFSVPGSQTSVQLPAGELPLTRLDSNLFQQLQATHHSWAPIMHAVVGGKTKFIRLHIGDAQYSLFTRYIKPDTTKPPTAAFSLLLDPAWLVKILPPQLDSLARESTQLLFFAPSPQNHEAIQSLGLIHGTDTLWWLGPKNVNVVIKQGLWSFPEIEVHTFVHWKGQDYTKRADSIRTIFQKQTQRKPTTSDTDK